jgi:hypothetical protein
MKKTTLFVLLFSFSMIAAAQLKQKVSCPTFNIDYLDGTVNGIHTDYNQARIKESLTCFSSTEPDTTACGGKVVYKDQDITFFPKRRYVVIGEKYKGKQSLPLLNSKRGTLYKWLGHPKMKDVDWDAFQTQYGCLVLYYNKANIAKKIIFSKNGTETIQICD